MIYIYCTRASSSAQVLGRLVGRRVRRIPPLVTGDHVVCWGERLDPIPGVSILNSVTVRSKAEQALIIARASVPTIEVRTVPPTEGGVDDQRALQVKEALGEFIDAPTLPGNPVYLETIDELIEMLGGLRDARGAPTWLPRKNSHVGGNDLMHPPIAPDFWTPKLDISMEYRVHSFMGRSIRAGVKRATDPLAHPWIRSAENGWSVSYDGRSVTPTHRALAHRAVASLGLAFGAVDLAETHDRGLIVLEVNTVPGIEGGTVGAYGRAIKRWAGVT